MAVGRSAVLECLAVPGEQHRLVGEVGDERLADLQIGVQVQVVHEGFARLGSEHEMSAWCTRLWTRGSASAFDHLQLALEGERVVGPRVRV